MHVLSGAVVVDPGSTALRRGESAVVPVALGGYDVAATEECSEVVEVSMPRGDAPGPRVEGPAPGRAAHQETPR